MKRGWNKKAAELLLENVIFFILVILFFVAMFYFVNRASTQASIAEQINAKQIALVIDKAKPGTEIIMDVSELYEIAKENDFEGHLVIIDNNNKKVVVNLASGKGYSYDFFNGAGIVWNLKDKKLYLEVVSNE